MLLPQSSQTALIVVAFHVSFGADMYVRGGLRGVFYLIWGRKGLRGVSRLGTASGVCGRRWVLFFEKRFIYSRSPNISEDPKYYIFSLFDFFLSFCFGA